MAGEHFETINLPLAKYSNDQIAYHCDFLHNIDTEFAQRKLTQCIGSERVMEVLSNRELRQLFVKEFDQLKQDRETLRNEIMISGVTDKVIMPVNLHRLIVNVKALNGINSN